ncbi:hypothetical protein CEXT_294951 [Caerostris extrusa]|uniref:Uncharacterized protein n=1 Tax=Caerostris extrusa TaxID=172846 RepID=A0AAV4RT63_CAEEX|nr:hypothetical protein CEXT_294951 [Caerostris extrusa]
MVDNIGLKIAKSVIVKLIIILCKAKPGARFREGLVRESYNKILGKQGPELRLQIDDENELCIPPLSASSCTDGCIDRSKQTGTYSLKWIPNH